MNPIKNDGIELVFIRSNELSNEQSLLKSKGRKQVRGGIDKEAFYETLEEALILDEEIAYPSKRKKKE